MRMYTKCWGENAFKNIIGVLKNEFANFVDFLKYRRSIFHGVSTASILTKLPNNKLFF